MYLLSAEAEGQQNLPLLRSIPLAPISFSVAAASKLLASSVIAIVGRPAAVETAVAAIVRTISAYAFSAHADIEARAFIVTATLRLATGAALAIHALVWPSAIHSAMATVVVAAFVDATAVHADIKSLALMVVAARPIIGG